MVSIRVVKVRISRSSKPSEEMSKLMSTPVLLPIQLFCMVRILSGHSSSPLESSNRSA